MADFTYVGQVSGNTIAAISITLTGTVEAGDFVTYARAKATASAVELGFLALEGGVDGDVILAYPVIAGMIFKGTADGDITEVGTQVALAVSSNAQVVDATGGVNLFFVSLDAPDISEDANVRVMYAGAYHNDLVT